MRTTGLEEKRRAEVRSLEASLFKDPSTSRCVVREGRKARLAGCKCVGCLWGVRDEAISETAGRIGEKMSRGSGMNV